MYHITVASVLAQLAGTVIGTFIGVKLAFWLFFGR